MFAFLASDSGLVVSWVLLCLGVADVLVGWWWFGRGRMPRDAALSGLRRWLPAVLLLDALLISVGLYGLRMHGLF